MTASAVFRSTLVIVTVTPGTTAPDASVMMPLMLPYTACACAGEDINMKVRKRAKKGAH